MPKAPAKGGKDLYGKIVDSEVAKEQFQQTLREIDSKAFTKEGVIHSYTIDKSSIKHNPMGGINVTTIINNDKELNIQDNIGKYNGKLDLGVSVISVKLSKLLEKQK